MESTKGLKNALEKERRNGQNRRVEVKRTKSGSESERNNAGMVKFVI